MENRAELLKSIFNKKNFVQKINYRQLICENTMQPNYPEGTTEFEIIKYSSNEIFGRNLGNVKIEFTLQDNNGNNLKQTFILKDGKNINLAKFIFQVLGYYPSNEIDLKKLEGKRIIATIFHYYTSNGVGYANIAFSHPA